jgi:2Fe-2S ferredoxin
LDIRVPRLIFIDALGKRTEIQAEVDRSLMQAAVAHGVEGIVAECGGACQCATCHVYVSDPWGSRLPPPGEQERVMLDNTAAERRASSRLSCQIQIRPELDGLTVQLPERQV